MPPSAPAYAPPDKRRRLADHTRTAFAQPLSAAAPPDPAVLALVGEVDQARLHATVKTLAGFPTRHSRSPHNVDAALWLRQQFEALGYTATELHDFTVAGTTRHNVVCTKPGTTAANEFVLVGAHYDSRMSDLSDFTTAAPGADDNASGTAALLELARVLKPVATACSVRFVAFSGEEQGLVGSSAYAAKANADGLKIRVMVNLDMIGHPANHADPVIVVERDLGNDRSENDAASQQYASRMASAAGTYTSIRADLGPIFDSDYMPFEHFGYPVIGAFDGADDQSFYHSVTDTPDKVDALFHAEVVRMTLATVFAVAND